MEISQEVFMPRPALWLMFLAGWSIHAMLQAKASAASKSNGLHSTREWFVLSWHIVLARGFLAALAMKLWCEAPALLGSALGVALAAPLTPATAGIFGYTADSVIDKLGCTFGIIKLEIPKLAPPTAPDSVSNGPLVPALAAATLPVRPVI
jgi:hypothetical protein